jgi:hypothetical protein
MGWGSGIGSFWMGRTLIFCTVECLTRDFVSLTQWGKEVTHWRTPWNSMVHVTAELVGMLLSCLVWSVLIILCVNE